MTGNSKNAPHNFPRIFRLLFFCCHFCLKHFVSWVREAETQENDVSEGNMDTVNGAELHQVTRAKPLSQQTSLLSNSSIASVLQLTFNLWPPSGGGASHRDLVKLNVELLCEKVLTVTSREQQLFAFMCHETHYFMEICYYENLLCWCFPQT